MAAETKFDRLDLADYIRDREQALASAVGQARQAFLRALGQYRDFAMSMPVEPHYTVAGNRPMQLYPPNSGQSTMVRVLHDFSGEVLTGMHQISERADLADRRVMEESQSALSKRNSQAALKTQLTLLLNSMEHPGNYCRARYDHQQPAIEFRYHGTTMHVPTSHFSPDFFRRLEA